MSSSWESSSEWYDKTVGKKGHYYHENVILPRLLPLLELKQNAKLLDLACGQGVLSRHLPKNIFYTGVDISPSLIQAAQSYLPSKHQKFITSDIQKPLDLANDYTHATILLALQNIESPLEVIENAHKHLLPQGKFIIVLNHPCYRIPRQSSWEVDPKNKIQYRRINRYFSPLKIPIQTHPSKQATSSTTFSYHFPLSSYTKWLKTAGFVIELIEEWCSDKKSIGAAASYENQSRKEFPLFLTLSAQKK